MFIKVGNVEFNADYLKEVTLAEAISHFRLHPEALVKEAYYKVNKKQKRK